MAFNAFIMVNGINGINGAVDAPKEAPLIKKLRNNVTKCSVIDVTRRVKKGKVK